MLSLDAPSSSTSRSSAAQVHHEQQLTQIVQPQQIQHNGHDVLLDASSACGQQFSSLTAGGWPIQQHANTSRNTWHSGASSHQQRQHRRNAPLLSIPPALLQRCCELVEQGSCQQADSMLWPAVMQLKNLEQLQAAVDALTAARLMRPAVVVALLVQLGKLATKQQRQQQQQLLQDRRQQQEQHSVEVNRQRQLRRQQQRQETMERELAAQAEAQAAAIQHARQALLERMQQQPPSQKQQKRLERVLQQLELQEMQNQAQQRQQQEQARQQAAGSASSTGQPALQNSLAQQLQEALVSQHVVPPQEAAASGSRSAAAGAKAAGHAQLFAFEQRQRHLLKCLVRHIKATNTADLSAMHLGLLPHWLAKLGVTDRQLLGRLQEAARAQVNADQAASLVPMVWGFAKALQGTAPAAARTVAGGSSSTAGRYGNKGARKAQQQQQQLLGRSSLNGSSGDSKPPDAQAQQQQVLAEVQVMFQVPDAEFVTAWLEASVPNLHNFSFSQLAASIYSLALLKRVPPQPWLDAFFTATLKLMRSASAQDLSNVLWALGTLQISPCRAAASAAAAETDIAAVDAAAAAANAAAAAGQGAAAAWAAASSAGDTAGGTDGGTTGGAGSWWAQFQVATVAVLWDFSGEASSFNPASGWHHPMLCVLEAWSHTES